jgi:hypothetical protein
MSNAGSSSIPKPPHVLSDSQRETLARDFKGHFNRLSESIVGFPHDSDPSDQSHYLEDLSNGVDSLIGVLIVMSHWPSRFDFSTFPDMKDWFSTFAPFENTPGGWKFLRALRDLCGRVDALRKPRTDVPAVASSTAAVPADDVEQESSGSEDNNREGDTRDVIKKESVSVPVPVVGDVVINNAKVASFDSFLSFRF